MVFINNEKLDLLVDWIVSFLISEKLSVVQNLNFHKSIKYILMKGKIDAVN